MRGTCWHLRGGVSRAQHPSKCLTVLPSVQPPSRAGALSPPCYRWESRAGNGPGGTGQSPASAQAAQPGSEPLPFRDSNSGGESKPSVPAFTGGSYRPQVTQTLGLPCLAPDLRLSSWPLLWVIRTQWACLRTRAAPTPGG